jgi:hypothetical protein
MKKFLLFLIIPVIVFGETAPGQGTKLDELLEKSGKIRQEGVRGFIIKNKSKTQAVPIPAKIQKAPEQGQKNVSSLAEFARAYSTPDTVPIPGVVSQYVPYSVYVSDVRRIDSLELQMAKMTAIMDNQVENAGTVKNSVELFIKFMEAFSGFVVALGSIVGWLKFRKKKG